VLAAFVDDGLDLAALHIDALDRAALIVIGLRSRHDHLAGGNPAEAAIVADVHLAVGAERRAIRAAGNLRDHLFPPVGINPRQPLAPDFDQHDRAVGHDHRAFRKLQIGSENADIGHESSRLFWAQADFQAYFPTRNSLVTRCYGKEDHACQPEDLRNRYYRGGRRRVVWPENKGKCTLSAYSYKYPTGLPSLRNGRTSVRVMI
jgi:hypothetical protein